VAQTRSYVDPGIPSGDGAFGAMRTVCALRMWIALRRLREAGSAKESGGASGGAKWMLADSELNRTSSTT